MRPISENYKGEVAQRWRFDDGAGEVGFPELLGGITRPLKEAGTGMPDAFGGRESKLMHGPDVLAGPGAGLPAARGPLTEKLFRQLAAPPATLPPRLPGGFPQRIWRPGCGSRDDISPF